MAAESLLDDLVQALEGAAANKEDIRSVDLDEVLVRVLATALRRHVGDCSLDDFEQRLLYALARYVARDGWVIRFTRDFVDLIDIDDAALGPRHIEIGGLDEAQENVFDILTDVASLRQRGGVGDAEGDIQNFCQRLRQQGLAAAGGADEQDRKSVV